jgi:hypothetical protein
MVLLNGDEFHPQVMQHVFEKRGFVADKFPLVLSSKIARVSM